MVTSQNVRNQPSTRVQDMMQEFGTLQTDNRLIPLSGNVNREIQNFEMMLYFKTFIYLTDKEFIVRS